MIGPVSGGPSFFKYDSDEDEVHGKGKEPEEPRKKARLEETVTAVGKGLIPRKGIEFPSEETIIDWIADHQVDGLKKALQADPRLATEKHPDTGLYLIEMVALHPEEKLARSLIEAVAEHMDDFDLADENGNSLLHFSYFHHAAYAEILLEKGGDPLYLNHLGMIPTRFMQVLKVPIPPSLELLVDEGEEHFGSKPYGAVEPFSRHREYSSDRELPVASNHFSRGLNLRDPKQPISSWMVGHSFRRTLWEEGKELAELRPHFRKKDSSHLPDVEEYIREYVDRPGEKKRFFVTDLIIELDREHWVLALVDTEKEQILLFDSLGEERAPLAPLAEEIGYEYVPMATKGQQQDGVSCGVYMNLYLQAFLQKIRAGADLPWIQGMFHRMVLDANRNPALENQRIQEYRQEVADNIAEMKWLSKRMKQRMRDKMREDFPKAPSEQIAEKSREIIDDFKYQYTNWEVEWYELYRQGYDLYDLYKARVQQSNKHLTVDQFLRQF